MEKAYPKRLFKYESELEVDKINNTCRMSSEYEKVKSDSVFEHVFAINENGLGFSAWLIHSMMCTQLVTKKKHELWFVWGNKPLRFSLQEFYAVTGFKTQDDVSCDLEKWEDDNGFWSKLLKRKEKICIKRLMKVHLAEAATWEEVDRIRLIYICVIAGLIKAKDEKKYIPLKYIKLVMDLEKVRNYSWGLKAFKSLVKSIIKKRKDLTKVKGYGLDGFSYAFQIWAMKAIPVIGELLGKKITIEFTAAPQCSNWKDVGRVSYDEIIQLEKTFKRKDVVYPYISLTGNFDVFSLEFRWPDENRDDEMDNLNALIRSGSDFGDHLWDSVVDDVVDVANEKDDSGGDSEVPEDDNEVSEPVDKENNETCDGEVSLVKKRSRKRSPDHGAEARKKKLLCQRAATTQGPFDELMKSIIEKFEASFASFEKKMCLVEDMDSSQPGLRKRTCNKIYQQILPTSAEDIQIRY